MLVLAIVLACRGAPEPRDTAEAVPETTFAPATPGTAPTPSTDECAGYSTYDGTLHGPHGGECVVAQPLEAFCRSVPGWTEAFGGCPTRDRLVDALATGEIESLYGVPVAATEADCPVGTSIEITPMCYDCPVVEHWFDDAGALTAVGVYHSGVWHGFVCCSGHAATITWYGVPPADRACGPGDPLEVAAPYGADSGGG